MGRQTSELSQKANGDNVAGGHKKQWEAKQTAKRAYPFQCCVVCGLQLRTCLAVAHLDHQPTNNNADNLAFLCHTHHWMHDAGLYPTDAIKMLRAHWQETEGVPCHKAKMKDAGRKAVQTKKKAALSKKRSESARKAVATRKKKKAETIQLATKPNPSVD